MLCVWMARRWTPHRPLSDGAAAPHIIALSHPTLESSAVVEQLQREHGIVCSSRAGAVRVSLAPYNDESDVEALTRALASFDSSGGGRGGGGAS